MRKKKKISRRPTSREKRSVISRVDETSAPVRSQIPVVLFTNTFYEYST